MIFKYADKPPFSSKILFDNENTIKENKSVIYKIFKSFFRKHEIHEDEIESQKSRLIFSQTGCGASYATRSYLAETVRHSPNVCDLIVDTKGFGNSMDFLLECFHDSSKKSVFFIDPSKDGAHKIEFNDDCGIEADILLNAIFSIDKSLVKELKELYENRVDKSKKLIEFLIGIENKDVQSAIYGLLSSGALKYHKNCHGDWEWGHLFTPWSATIISLDIFRDPLAKYIYRFYLQLFIEVAKLNKEKRYRLTINGADELDADILDSVLLACKMDNVQLLIQSMYVDENTEGNKANILNKMFVEFDESIMLSGDFRENNIVLAGSFNGMERKIGYVVKANKGVIKNKIFKIPQLRRRVVRTVSLLNKNGLIIN